MRQKMLRLDRINLRILQKLQVNAEISNARLADEICLSPSACLERVRFLERSGIIRKYVADYDLSRICHSISIFVEIVLKNHREADFNRFLSAIRGRPEVLECHKVSGKIDYMLWLVCRDVEHYSEISDFLGSDELGVEKAQGHVVLGQEKPFKGYPLDMLMQAN